MSFSNICLPRLDEVKESNIYMNASGRRFYPVHLIYTCVLWDWHILCEPNALSSEQQNHLDIKVNIKINIILTHNALGLCGLNRKYEWRMKMNAKMQLILNLHSQQHVEKQTQMYTKHKLNQRNKALELRITLI